MSLENDLQRHLRARAAAVRTAPDLGDLSARLRVAALRADRRDRRLVGAAAAVLALAVGGLAGALVTRPMVVPTTVQRTRGVIGPVPGARRQARMLAPPGHSSATRSSVLRLAVGGVSGLATVQSLPSPVAVMTSRSPEVSCSVADLVTTTVGRSGAFAGGAGVVGLPPLAPAGLEAVDSGVLPTATGAEVWWLTVATGSSVARVAAQGPGGQVVTATPSDGVALLAGVEATGVAGAREISAVAEGSQGGSLSSLGVLIGSGPKVVGEQAPSAASRSIGGRSCDVLRLPPVASPAAVSQPTDVRLAAAAVVTAYEEAFAEPPAPSIASVGSGSAPGLPGVTVKEVSFLSATKAEVVYRPAGGLWQTGLAVLGSGGRWVVARLLTCGSISGGAFPVHGTGSCPSG